MDVFNLIKCLLEEMKERTLKCERRRAAVQNEIRGSDSGLFQKVKEVKLMKDTEGQVGAAGARVCGADCRFTPADPGD